MIDIDNSQPVQWCLGHACLHFYNSIMIVTFLALGSNLGDREGHLQNAVNSLSKRGVKISRCAALYETQPKGVPNQPWFLNTVIRGHTNLDAPELLRECLAIERENGRIRSGATNARTLDIDILFYGDRII